MDSLTNIYNRYGFDELVEEMIAKNPNAHYVVALFDIDDFKLLMISMDMFTVTEL